MKNCCLCYFLLFALVLDFLPSAAQEKCGIQAYQELLHKHNPKRSGEQEFEHWLLEKQQLRSKGTFGQQKAEETVYQIPVVIHVIHNGEPEGAGANIPESQIIAQLNTLNQDFRALNQDQIAQLPASFRALAADTRIEFVLAKQDPEGLPTNGITRYQGSRTSYSIDNDFELKSIIHWPPEDYMNIYSVGLAGNLLGYAQFPETDRLAGLDLGMVSARTDGVVVDYRYFGQGGSAVESSTGRTATHEVGHFLGLRHIWGDGDCDRDDYVEDTPVAADYYDGCPTGTQTSCGTPDMYQNYMDYTNDACMSLFTPGQAERMEIVLQHSPRRNSLLTSNAKEEPTIVANDAGIRQFALEFTDQCNKDFIPQLTLRNYGSNEVSRVEIALYVNGLEYTRQTVNLQLEYLEMETIQLPEVILGGSGEFIAEARILSTNGTNDNKEINNQLQAEVYVPEERDTPYLQDFETSLSPYYRINRDFNLTWELTQAPINGDPDNIAIYLNYFDYSSNTGTQDLLISPVFDLSEEDQAFLSFRVAHATYGRTSNDRLQVYVSTDCAENLETATLVYSKAGEELATTGPMQTPFRPSGNSDWRTELLDLSPFAGNSEIQLIFVGTNDYGNNIYLDDIDLYTEPREGLDVELRAITSPSVVSCETAPTPSIQIRNIGSETIQELTVLYSLNGGQENRLQLTNLDLESQQSLPVPLPTIGFGSEGEHVLQVRLSAPNNGFDVNPNNDIRSKRFIINTNEDVIPLREYLRAPSLANSSWVSTSPDPDIEGWTIRSVTGRNSNSNYALVSEFYGQNRGHENWLVSPTLDLSDVSAAGLQFSYSYAPLANASDILQVRVSTDCGQSWGHIVYEKKGSELSTRIVNSRWSPLASSDWFTSFVNLQDFVGLSDVRVAIIAISDAGNDLYLDDLEFFESNVPITVPLPTENGLSAYPNPTPVGEDLRVIFNLSQREDVLIQLYDSRGRLVFESTQPNTLNQVYSMNTDTWQGGLYVLRVSSTSIQHQQRIIVAK